MTLAGLAILTSLFLFSGLVDLPYTTIVREVLLLAAAATLLLRLFMTKQIVPSLENQLGPPRPSSPSSIEVEDNEKEVAQRYDGRAIEYFMQLLTGLPLYLQRVNEYADIQSHYIHLKTDLTFRLNVYSDTSSALSVEAANKDP